MMAQHNEVERFYIPLLMIVAFRRLYGCVVNRAVCRPKGGTYPVWVLWLIGIMMDTMYPSRHN